MALEDKDKIEILLKEYDRLGQEILGRINNRFVMLGLVGAFLGVVFFKESPILTIQFWGLSVRTVLAISGLIALIAIWIYFGYLTGTLARRVSSIEKRVNELAGEDLLMWESRYGWARWGKFSGAGKKVD
jgi:hypothetical protein